MYVAVNEDEGILVLTDEEVQELDDKRDGSGLILTDHFDKKYIVAVIDTQLAYNKVKREADKRNISLIFMNRCYLDQLKEGKVLDYSDVAGYRLYLSMEQGLEALGYEKSKSNNIINFTMDTTSSLQ